MQVIRRDYRTYVIQPALHSYAGDLPDLVYALQSKHHFLDSCGAQHVLQSQHPQEALKAREDCTH